MTYFVTTANTNNGLSAGVPLTFTQDISSISNQAFTLGQQLAAASLPVVLTAAQITTLTPPTSVGITGTPNVSVTNSPTVINGAGSALMGKVGIDQTTQGTTNFVTSNITQVGGSSLVLGQQLAASSLPVVLTAAQITTLTPPTTITLGAGSAIVGKFTTDQTTHGTTDLVAADITKVAGTSIATGHGTASGAIRVELPTDGTGVVINGAGTAVMGKVGIDQTTPGTTNAVQTIPNTTGGVTPYLYAPTGAANQDSTVLKASAGNVYNIQVANIGSSLAWLKLYNSSTGPTSGSTPVKVIPIPANSTAANGAGTVISYGSLGLSFSSGISFRVSTGIANSDATAVSSSNIIINIDYN